PARLRPAVRLQDIDARDPGDRALEDLRDLRLDDVRRSSGIGRGDRDGRLVDVRILADRQPGVGDDAQEHQNEAEDAREDRAPDTDLDRVHQLFSSSRFRCDWTTSTSTPFRSLSCPATTTVESALRPERI